MKPENLKFLQDQLFFTGFSHDLDKKLEQAMKKGKEEFSLETKATYTTFDVSKDIHFSLNFRKGNDDMVFFNNYKANLGDKQMTVYINHGDKNITSKEAFNMLEGRSVYRQLTNKQGEKFNAWVQLNADTKQGEKTKFNLYNDNYGFDPLAALKTLNQQGFYAAFNKDNVLNDLRKGNLITMHDADKSKTLLLAAEPKFKNFTAFSSSGDIINLNDLMKQAKEGKSEKAGISI